MELTVGATFTLGCALGLMGVLLWPTARPPQSCQQSSTAYTYWEDHVISREYLYVTGHGKTGLNCTRIEMHFIVGLDSHVHVLSLHSGKSTILCQVCFSTRLLLGPLKPRQSTREAVRPVGSTNKVVLVWN